MGKQNQFLSTQTIFQQVFQNASGKLKGSLGHYTTQDYLNAVFDNSKDALRISVEGGALPTVGSLEELSSEPTLGEVGAVVPGDGTIQFYQWNGEAWSPLGGTGSGGGSSSLSPEMEAALSWLVGNLDRVKELTSTEYIVQTEVLTLSPDTSVPVVLSVQGEFQDIDDDGDKDGDLATHYRVDLSGYVVGVETYENQDALTTDRYYTKVVYEPGTGGAGTSHIYLTKEEYDWFSGLGNGKNILKIFYLSTVFPGAISVQEEKIAFPYSEAAPVVLSIQGEEQDIDDDGDKDGDPTTHFRVDISGYVLDLEGYDTQEDIISQRFYTKMSYLPEINTTSIYFSKEEYEQISSLTDGKNVITVFYLKQR